MKRPLVKAMWLLLLAGNVSAQIVERPVRRESAYELATEELRSYCMGPVCLGMTIDEVSKLGRLTWNKLNTPDGKVRCNSLLGNELSAHLGTPGSPASAGLWLSFDLVNASGDLKSRYRLREISFDAPDMTEAGVSAFAESFKTRLGPMKELLARGAWSAYVENFFITVGAAPAEKNRPKRLVLMANYRMKTQWTMSQPECKNAAGKPPINE